MSHHRSSRERSEREESPGRLIRARTALEVGEAAAHLETLAQALRAGGVTVRRGSELAELKLEAGEEGAQSVLRLELRWETPQPEERLEITPGVESPVTGQGAPGSQGSPGTQGGPSSPGGQSSQGRGQGGQGRPGNQGRSGGQGSGEQASGAEGS